MNSIGENKGYNVLTGTSPIAVRCSGFTPTSDTFAISAIVHPSARGARAYTNNSASLVALVAGSFVKGKYYPIPFSSITLSAGTAIGWID
jgi:hypothetical protein